MFGTEIAELLLSISCYFVVSVDDEDNYAVLFYFEILNREFPSKLYYRLTA